MSSMGERDPSLKELCVWKSYIGCLQPRFKL
jgi:hypothetical protein